MTDRELLELAARAAGLEVWRGKGHQAERLFAAPNRGDSTGVVTGVEWNPLEDDGDALRLAVKLRMQILLSVSEVTMISEGRDGKTHQILERFRAVDLGEYKATRRAIVRAAAEIGKGGA